jgi:transcriptional regulator with XRE-family HTH domain
MTHSEPKIILFLSFMLVSYHNSRPEKSLRKKKGEFIMGYGIFWGERLRSARAAKKLTQKEVAGILHISRQTYSSYETGRLQPTPEVLAVLSNIYETDLFEYAIQCMPLDYVAEQMEFKYSMKSGKIEQNRELARRIKTRKHRGMYWDAPAEEISGDNTEEANAETEVEIQTDDSFDVDEEASEGGIPQQLTLEDFDDIPTDDAD